VAVPSGELLTEIRVPQASRGQLLGVPDRAIVGVVVQGSNEALVNMGRRRRGPARLSEHWPTVPAAKPINLHIYLLSGSFTLQ
jgi:hypothetical protein